VKGAGANAPSALGGGGSGVTPRAVVSLLDGERIVHVLSWHQVQNEEQRGEVLQQVKERPA
jgi:hypothetical protein